MKERPSRVRPMFGGLCLPLESKTKQGSLSSSGSVGMLGGVENESKALARRVPTLYRVSIFVRS